jgi:ectoine hydroxylase
MRLTQKLLSEYQEQGHLFFPGYFSAAEMGAIQAELPAIFAEEAPQRVLEKDGLAVRSVYGSHNTNEILGRLARDARLVEPAMQILESAVYIHQFKINAKAAFGGDKWEWHQDYIFWRNEDGMPAPRVTNVLIFVDETNEFNGPLMLIPGSHREKVLEIAGFAGVPDGYGESPLWISNLTAKLKYALSKELLARLVEQYGMVAPKGPRGSVLIFHGNLVHGSGVNMSPFERRVICISYNSVENIPRPVEKQRPEFLAGRDYRPLELLRAAESSLTPTE